jgi:hypothetical protein
MNLLTEWVVVAAALALLLGLLLVMAGRGLRRSRGLGGGRTVSLDRVMLTSYRLGLTGRPDRLVKAGGAVIVEEWKSARLLQPQHRAQMGVYFLLVVRHGSVTVECGNGVTEGICTATSRTGGEVSPWGVAAGGGPRR